MSNPRRSIPDAAESAACWHRAQAAQDSGRWREDRCVWVEPGVETWLMRQVDTGEALWRCRMTLRPAQAEVVYVRLTAIAESRVAGLAPLLVVRRDGHVVEVWHSVRTAPTLRELADAGWLRRGDVLAALRQAAGVLDDLARRGLVHGEPAPEHLALDESGVTLWSAGYPDLLETEGENGALGYLAPERCRGGAHGAAADQYVLAITGIELLTGRNPLIPNDPMVMAGLRPVPLAGLPAEIRGVFARALDADPGRRWPSSTAFAMALADASGP